MSAGQYEGGRDAALGDPLQDRVHPVGQRLGQVGGGELPSVGGAYGAPYPVGVGAGQQQGPGGRGHAVHAGPVGDRGQLPGGRVQQQHLLLGRVAQARLDQQQALVDPGHCADLDTVPGEQLAVHREGAGGAARGVGGGQHPPVGEAGRGAGDQRVHPLRVRGAGELPGAAGGRVGGEQ